MNNIKSHINIIAIGHVDAGKSTTIGHLMYRCGGADYKQIARHELEGGKIGKGSFKYAWLSDRLPAERERGLTINLTHWKLWTSKYSVNLIDSPGHRDYTKNMLAGTSQADAAILFVSAATGEFEAGIATSGQTHEHSLLAYTFGIKRLVVAVNKMDVVEYSQERYDEIVKQTSTMLKKIGYRTEEIHFIPISGWYSDNLVETSNKYMPWYQGLTLLDALEAIPLPTRTANDKPLRIPVQDVYRIGGIGTVVVGRVETGVLKYGMILTFAPPAPTLCEVKSIERHFESIAEAGPGEYIGFHASYLSARELHRGMVAGTPVHPPLVVQSFTAKIIIVNHPGVIGVGYTPVLSCHTAHVACKFTELISKLDKNGEVSHKSPAGLKNGDTAIVTLEPSKPLCVEPYAEFPSLGRFVLRDLRQTVAVGIVQSVLHKNATQGIAASSGLRSRP